MTQVSANVSNFSYPTYLNKQPDFLNSISPQFNYLSLFSGIAESTLRFSSCLASLSLGAIASTKMNSFLALVPAVLLCAPTAEAKSDPLTSTLKTVGSIVEKLDNFNSIKSKWEIGERIARITAGAKEKEKTLPDHFIDSLLKVASDVSALRTPLQSIVTSIRDALADEAVARFKGFVDLKRLYDDVNRLQVQLPKLNDVLTSTFQADGRYIDRLIANLNIDKLQQERDALFNELEKTHAATVEIQKYRDEYQAKIDSLIPKINEIRREMNDIIDFLNNEALSDEQYHQLDSLLQRYKQGHENAMQRFDFYKKERDEGSDQFEKGLSILQEGMSLVNEKDLSISSLKQKKQKLRDVKQALQKAHSELVKSEIQNVKDLIQAKLLHLQVELERAKKANKEL